MQFLRVEGTDLSGAVIDELLVDGTVSDVIRRVEEKLVAHNRTSVDFTSQPREERTALYPMTALQQITRNSILHRTYEGAHAPTRVTWYDDRIEVTSPGGPYGEVNRENFGTPGITDYRNPNLAEAMRVLGYVQKFGGGVGKTSLVYHLAWMYAELGVNVVAADLDPQANLTTMFLDEDAIEGLWTDGAPAAR